MSALAGRRALVTGGGAGIGQAIALRLAADGARVAVLDRDVDAAWATVEQIATADGDALAVRADVSREDEVAAAVGQAVASFGGLDIVCAGAGIQLFGQDARCHEVEVEVWDRTLAVNMRGMFLTCKHSLSHLMVAGGSLICLGSPTGLYGVAPGFTAYSASKASTLGLVRVIAADYAQFRVRANMVVPGFTDTPLVRSITEDRDLTERELARIPLGRAGQPAEVAAMVSFLASDDAAFCTGGVFPVDGGSMAV